MKATKETNLFIRMILVMAAAGLLAACMVVPVLAQSWHVTDTYGLFSEQEMDALENACTAFEESTGIQTAILSIDAMEAGGSRDQDSIRYIEAYADSLPQDDFIGLLINMDTRYYYIDIRGDQALRIYTDSRQEELGDAVVSQLASGNYAAAGRVFLDGAARQYTYAVEHNSYGTIREEKSGFRAEILGAAGVLSALVSAIVTAVRARRHQNRMEAADANRSIVPGTIDMYKNRNVFVSQYVTRVPIIEEKSGGGGGGFTTTHTSGGGHSHSGHGGHF